MSTFSMGKGVICMKSINNATAVIDELEELEKREELGCGWNTCGANYSA